MQFLADALSLSLGFDGQWSNTISGIPK